MTHTLKDYSDEKAMNLLKRAAQAVVESYRTEEEPYQFSAKAIEHLEFVMKFIAAQASKARRDHE